MEMARVTLFLLAMLASSLMAAGQQRSKKPRKMFRGTREEEEARAEGKFPGWTTCDVNPWELSGHYEGDMLVANRSQLRYSLRDPNTKWPYKEVPYRFDPFYLYDDEIQHIQKIIDGFNNLTCVKLRPAQDFDNDYVLITGKRVGCCVNIGRIGGVQELNLEPPACIYKTGCVYHQIMHALGFVHEHNSPSRDKYVKIYWKNIKEGKEEFFQKMDPADITNYATGYDYYSIMHGSRKYFSKNDLNTIEPLDEMVIIGQRETLSINDIRRIKRRHGCAWD